eukprot:scaffold1442_cov128-Cylindrotheca_fusiformis.AAC.9
MRNLLLLVLFSLLPLFACFTTSSSCRSNPLGGAGVDRQSQPLQESATTEDATSLSEPEQRVYDLLEDLHESKFDFRIVVVGNGAILETTAELGPNMKMSQSPATEENLVTFASDDSSFEFHLKIAQVSKIVMMEKESPTTAGRTMRVMRFLNNTGRPVCSLILSSDTVEAAEWFSSISAKYGPEMQL